MLDNSSHTAIHSHITPSLLPIDYGRAALRGKGHIPPTGKRHVLVNQHYFTARAAGVHTSAYKYSIASDKVALDERAVDRGAGRRGCLTVIRVIPCRHYVPRQVCQTKDGRGDDASHRSRDGVAAFDNISCEHGRGGNAKPIRGGGHGVCATIGKYPASATGRGREEDCDIVYRCTYTVKDNSLERGAESKERRCGLGSTADSRNTGGRAGYGVLVGSDVAVPDAGRPAVIGGQ